MESLGLTYALIAAVAFACLIPFAIALRERSSDLFEPVCWA
jgi:hypothetical protein